MYKIILFTALLLLTAGNTIAGQPDTVVICGKLEHYKQKEISVGCYRDYLYYQKKVLGSCTTDKDGNFRITFLYAKPWPAYLILENNNINLFLIPGDSLAVSADAKKFVETAVFNGRGSKVNGFISKYLFMFYESHVELKKSMAELPEKEFLSLNDALYKQQLDFFNKNFSEESGATFTEYQDKRVVFEYARAMVICPYYMNILDYAKNYNISYGLNSLESMIDSTDLNNQYALTSMVYVDFLMDYLDYVMPYYIDPGTGVHNVWDFKYKLAKKLFNSNVRDLLLAKILKNAFEYTYRMNAMIMYNDYQTVYMNKEYFMAIKKQFIDH